MRLPRKLIHCGFTLVELLVVIAIIGVLIGLIVPAVRAARASSRNTACKNNLHQMGIALDLHNGAHDAYPVDGENGYGICAFMLPYLEQQPLYDRLKPKERRADQFDLKQPELGGARLEVFLCPAINNKAQKGGLGPRNYSGTSNLFSTVKIYDDIRDGESNTIAMGEGAGGSWVLPGLASGSPPSEGGSFGSRHGGGANFVFCDASVHFIREDIDPAVFAALCTIDGKEAVSGWE